MTRECNRGWISAALQRKMWLLILGMLTVLSSTLGSGMLGGSAVSAAERRPNIVIIFADDLGYGDLGCYGHPTIRTPHLDRMAREGLRCTQFYSAAEVCTPSRAGLLTGRLPIRSGMCDDNRRVLFPNSAGGLPEEEITLAEGLRAQGYRTACIGKWHLGHLPPFMPTRHGFEYYFGIPYSNDMKPCPLMRNDETLEEPAEQTTLTRRYTDEAVAFIEKHKSEPFFLYMPQTFPHIPLFASDEFKGKSPRGLYGDVVEELDASVGRVLDKLRELKLDQHTLVCFSSDNGPWLTQKQNGGTAGLLRDGKGSTWEGGMRVPGIFWWPGKIEAGRTTTELASTLDLFATSYALAGAPLPDDRVLDSYDLAPLLFRQEASPRKTFFYYRGAQLMATRMGPWKAHFTTQGGYAKDRANHAPPLLFHLDHDASETYNLADKQKGVVAEIERLTAEHRQDVKPAPSQLVKKIGE